MRILFHSDHFVVKRSFVDLAVASESERHKRKNGGEEVKKSYAPLPISLLITMSSQEMYGDSSDLARIPSKSHVQFSLVAAQKILALDGSSFAVHANLKRTVIVLVSPESSTTVYE